MSETRRAATEDIEPLTLGREQEIRDLLRHPDVPVDKLLRGCLDLLLEVVRLRQVNRDLPAKLQAAGGTPT